MRIVFLLLISASLKAQCIRAYCADTSWLPSNSMCLVGYSTGADSSGWKQLTGPSKISIPKGDSVAIFNLQPGSYSFQYWAQGKELKTLIDNVQVIPLKRQVTYIDLLRNTATYTDGKIENIRITKDPTGLIITNK